MPMPRNRSVASEARPNAPVTTTSNSAAELIMVPVRTSPVRIASAVVAPAARASAIRDSRNVS